MEGTPRIDLSRYPIDAAGSPEHGHLVSSCRAAIADTGACVLEGFVPPTAVADIGRLVGVLSYAGAPGRRTNAGNRRTFYGRHD